MKKHLNRLCFKLININNFIVCMSADQDQETLIETYNNSMNEEENTDCETDNEYDLDLE